MSEKQIYPNLNEDQMRKLHDKMSQQEDLVAASIDDPFVQGNDTENSPKIISTKEKIREVESEIDTFGNTHSLQVIKVGDLTFKDDVGNETFYVRNISGRHVLISDIQNMEKIPSGKSVDLLRFASIEDIKKSRDLRNALGGPDRILQRITEDQYLEDLTIERDQIKRVEVARRQAELKRMQASTQSQNQNILPHERAMFSPFPEGEEFIRPVIKAKLGSLALRNDKDPEHAAKAMTPPEFVMWISSEKLTHDEIDYIMGDPAVVRDHDIRAALMEKKRSIPPR